jgi:hypothetical protein
VAATAAFFALRISERMSVSSRTLAIDAAHPGPFSGLVGGRTDAINQVRIVPHQPQ